MKVYINLRKKKKKKSMNLIYNQPITKFKAMKIIVTPPPPPSEMYHSSKHLIL